MFVSSWDGLFRRGRSTYPARLATSEDTFAQVPPAALMSIFFVLSGIVIAFAAALSLLRRFDGMRRCCDRPSEHGKVALGGGIKRREEMRVNTTRYNTAAKRNVERMKRSSEGERCWAQSSLSRSEQVQSGCPLCPGKRNQTHRTRSMMTKLFIGSIDILPVISVGARSALIQTWITHAERIKKQRYAPLLCPQ